MASHEHKYVKVGEDDVVVISAHAIPGNESNVARVIDAFYRTGAKVVHDGNAPVHVSGHASQEELKFLLNLVEPEYFIPVHGEFRHMVHHAELALGAGVKPENVFVCEDGDQVTISDQHVDVDRQAVPAGLHLRRRHRRRHRPGRAARPAPARRGGRRRGVRHRRPALRQDRERPRDRHQGLGPRHRGRGAARGGDATRSARRSRTRPSRAAPTSRPCAAAPGARSGKFINEKTKRRPAIIPVVLEV